MVPDQETFVHCSWFAQHFCMLPVIETSEQHGDKHCNGGAAKNVFLLIQKNSCLPYVQMKIKKSEKKLWIISGS